MTGSRPYVLLSCAMSVDGYIDDSSDTRLLLSNDEDFDRVDEVRAGVDAILVGAGTIRADNPRLLVRSEERRRARIARGLAESPLKVTLTASGDLDPEAKFFAMGEVDKIVYCAGSSVETARSRLAGAPTITVVDAGQPLSLRMVLGDLAGRGVERLMVEGGRDVHTRFLTEGLADELQLVVAPFFVGDPKAPRFVGDGSFPGGRMTVAEVRQIGDVVLIRYLPSPWG